MIDVEIVVARLERGEEGAAPDDGLEVDGTVGLDLVPPGGAVLNDRLADVGDVGAVRGGDGTVLEARERGVDVAFAVEKGVDDRLGGRRGRGGGGGGGSAGGEGTCEEQ